MRDRMQSSQGIPTSLSKALDRHFVACAAVATATVVAGQAQHAQASILYSGVQNVPLTDGSPGVYINLVTNASSGSPAGAPGWDINPYINTFPTHHLFAIYLPPSTAQDTKLVKSSSPTAGTADVGKLAAGTLIGPSSTLVGQTGVTPHFVFMNDATTGDWVPAGTGFMGVQFTDPTTNGGNPVYGWVQISKTVAGEPPVGGPDGITFVDWAYDNTGSAIAAGDTGASPVPEPTTLALMAAGAVGILVRRGRVKLRPSEPAVG